MTRIIKLNSRRIVQRLLLCALFLGCLCWCLGGFKARADETTTSDSSESTEASGTNETPPASTPSIWEEPSTSDLTLIQAATKLASKRWIQSFCKDSKYYYFLQMTNPYKGHLRLTRVAYTGVDKYTSSYMDLKGFGHGTNLDCSISGGKTWLWTGGDCKKFSGETLPRSRSITAFKFTEGRVLYKHGPVRYFIPRGKNGKKVTNVYPAVNVNSNRLAVRYTYKGAQYYQFYILRSGKKIKTRKPIKVLRLSKTSGDFQGFDITGKTIYTIEGSPTKAFLQGYDKTRKFQPTIIRTYNYISKQKTTKRIRGASVLPFREPEGVKLIKGGRVQILFVSGTLTNMRANIYQVKK